MYNKLQTISYPTKATAARHGIAPFFMHLIQRILGKNNTDVNKVIRNGDF